MELLSSKMFDMGKNIYDYAVMAKLLKQKSQNDFTDSYLKGTEKIILLFHLKSNSP